jgi:hypothetical protein
MKRNLSAAIFLILPVCVMSQTAETDTLAAGGARDELIDMTDAGAILRPWRPVDELLDPMCYFALPPSYTAGLHTVSGYKVGFTSEPYIFRWHTGGLYGAAASVSMPGLMAVESGRLTFEQELGQFTLSVYGEALKYGYFRGLTSSYGFGGSVTYRASDRLSLTLFGSYYSPMGALTPAMAGYMNVPSVGAYADYSFSDRWGVKAGVQSYRSMVTGRWETQPMVMPYFKISPQHSIGLDVGGMLYQIIKSAAYDKNDTYSNPTIPPPLMRMPEVF